MRLLVCAFFIFLSAQLYAQERCASHDYRSSLLQQHPEIAARISEAENSIKASAAPAKPGELTIVIPVVVHILYNNATENVSNQQVFDQIRILNECFRRRNADTSNTPGHFKNRAADVNIEFKLAISDPRRRGTTGIIRRYTPVKSWRIEDRMKFDAEAGSTAWDASKYLNIWVCNLGRMAGYASVPGGPAEIDGVVINYTSFGLTSLAGLDLGKTAVHEIGHWLGLKHIWGDEYCGDDGIHDTPRQSYFTTGCPTGMRSSCDNASGGGDMYMNYMDITLDGCTNMFTNGQADLMYAQFSPGGVRASLLRSFGNQPPLINDIPLAEQEPEWFHPHLYPNPSTSELKIDLAYDVRWIGSSLQISNVHGQLVQAVQVTSKLTVVDVSRLKPGIYFISGKKADGATVRLKFVKQ